MTTTPALIDRDVLEFCSIINPDSNPVYVKVSPREFARLSDCFYNVRKAIESFGGKFAYGWMIWLWPNVLIEAEHHALWETSGGRLVDITAKTDGERKIVFLPDDSATYDFEKDLQLDNVRKPLVEDPDVKRFLKLGADSVSIRKSNRRGQHIVMTPELRLLESQQGVLLQRLRDCYPARVSRGRRRRN
jgi:hypothetical protein